jgi:integrase/recombinase XerD
MLNHVAGFEKSLRILEGLSQVTVESYKKKVLGFHAWLIDNDIPAAPRQITRKHIESYMEHCFNAGNANITRLTKLTALAKFFRYLKYDGVIAEDISAEIPRPQVTAKLMSTFTREEVLRFFRQCDPGREKGLRDLCILILAAFCGLRMNEIITLDLNDIIDDGTDIDINVKGKRRGGRVSRQVYIWKAPGLFVRQYLMTRLSHSARGSDPFLVTYNHGKPKGRRMTAAAVHKLIKCLAADAEIRKAEIHAHVFRSTHANDLRHVKGYDMPAIQERLGWKDLSTAGRYLVRRERIHRTYNSLHEYWIDFTKIWKEDVDADGPAGVASTAADEGGPDIGR